MALYKPIIVNGKCEVLKGHCKRSGGGVWYEDYDAFCKNMEFLYSEKYSEMCAKAREYIDKNYSWDVNYTQNKKFHMKLQTNFLSGFMMVINKM